MAQPLRLHTTIVDLPPDGVQAGTQCTMQVETFLGSGAVEPYVAVQLRVLDAAGVQVAYQQTYTNNVGKALLTIQTIPTSPTGMWTAMATRSGRGDCVTFPVV